MPTSPRPIKEQRVNFERNAANIDSDAALLCALKAYRAARDDFVARLFALVDSTAGVTYRRDADGIIRGETIGWLALECGLGDRAEELANGMKARLENNAQRDGSYLADWDEDGGASIATYVVGMGRFVAQGIGRKAVEDAINLGAAAHEKSDDAGTRARADRAIAAHKASDGRTDLPTVVVESTSDYESSRQRGAADGPPSPVPAAYRTTDSPMFSQLRVGSLLSRFECLADEMCQPDRSVVVKGKTKPLTVNHGATWLAFLGLGEDQRQNLDVSWTEVCRSKGWTLDIAKAELADCFAFLQGHSRFDEVCELMVPSRISKHASEQALAKYRNDVKVLIGGDGFDGNARDAFRKLIQHWIAQYGGV